MTWTGQNWGPEQPRFVTDLTGDGKADIVGFGSDGVWTALGTDGWGLSPAYRVLPGFFGYDQGWRTGRHLRAIANLSGHGDVDLVGFGEAGVLTALGNKDGTFSHPRLFMDFGVKQRWHLDRHPRFVADFTGDGKADLIGFGEDEVWIAIGNGDGTFQDPKPVLSDLVYNTGWRVDQHPRFVVDLTGDRKADIIGFGDEFVWVALNNGDGTFRKPEPVLGDLVHSTGWRVDQHPRLVVDLTGDGKADLVGFGPVGVKTAISKGDGTFGEPNLMRAFGFKQGWRVDQHLRLLPDLNGDGKADIIGFGNDDGPWVALGNGDGTFQPARFVQADVGDHPVGDHIGPFVQSITLDFHTHDDDLDHDTELHVFVKNRRSDSSEPDGPSTYVANLQAYEDHDSDWFRKNPYLGYALNASQGKTFEDHSTHRVNIQLRSQPIPVEELLLPAVHLHILTTGDDEWKFDYTLTITLDDGTVLPPFHSKIEGLDEIVLNQDRRNYYDICSDVRLTPARTKPATDAILTGVTIEFHTHDDDKDHDTRLNIHIVNRLSATESWELAGHNDLAKGQPFHDSDDDDTTIDETYTRIDLTLASNAILLRDIVLPVVFIDITPNGNDQWIFDYRVTLFFGEDQPYSWTMSGVALDQDHRKHMGVYNGRPFPIIYAPQATLSSSSIQRSKTISLASLQQKLDELLNRRQTIESPDPIIKLKLDSEKRLGKTRPPSFMDLQFIVNNPPPPDGASLDPNYRMGVTYLHSISELPDRIRNAFIGFGDQFNDLNLQSLSLNARSGDNETPLMLNLQFETEGPTEITGSLPIDVIKFEITLRFTLRFHSETGAVDLFGWVDDLSHPEHGLRFSLVSPTNLLQYKVSGTFLGQPLNDLTTNPDRYKTDLIGQVVHVNFTTKDTLDPGGLIQRRLREGIFNGLSGKNPITKTTPRESINAQVSSFLMGGVIASGNPELVAYPNPCRLLDVDVSNDVLTLNYLGPEKSFVDPPPSDWPSTLEPGTLANIDHIVVLMQENRSFDHMLGYLSLPYERGGMNRTDVDGLKGGEINSFNGRIIPSFRLAAGDTIFSPGPRIDAAHTAVQINGGKMHGFVQSQGEAYGSGTAHRVMGYHTADNLPTYDSLARDFAIGHRWFASHPGASLPNRFYELTGRLNIDEWGAWEYENPNTLRPVFTETIFDYLTKGGVSWATFEHFYSFVRFFEQYTFDSEHIVSFNDPVKGFAALAKSGNLPSVSFIEPHYMDYPPDSFCDEPPSDVRKGQIFTRELVETLVASPKWDKTLLIIIYDEHGGFYDHVPPQPAVKVSPEMLDTTGVRVPCFVISPWVKGGSVFGSDVLHFDHTSILKTIARRFLSNNPPYMGARYAAAHDLSEVLDSQIRPQQFRPFIPYTLLCGASNMGLDVQNSSVSFGAPLCQLAPDAKDLAQDFRFEDAGNGLFYIRTFAGLYVTVDTPAGAPTGAGGTLKLKQDRKYEPGSSGSQHPDLQKWKFTSSTVVATTPDEYTISCAAVSGKVLQPENSSTASGASVVPGNPADIHSPTVIPNPWTVTSRLLPSGGILAHT